MSHIGIIGQATDGRSYSWFCREFVKGNCPGEGEGYSSREDAEAAIVAFGHEVEDEARRPGRFAGIPGLVWYATVTKTYGRDLKVGDWLDSLNHEGARRIADITPADPTTGLRTVTFPLAGSEQVRADVVYDVVDPDSQVAPDGSPL